MGRGVVYSSIIHACLIALAFVNLPDWFQKEREPEPMVITLEHLMIKDKTNVMPSPKPIIKPKDRPKPKKEDKPKPPLKPKPPPPPPPPPKPSPPPKPTEPEKVKEDKPKPEKKAPKPEPVADPLKEVLKNLEKQEEAARSDQQEEPEKEAAPASNTTNSEAPYDPTAPLSLSERDAITSQFVKCWRLPAGAANDYSLKVTVDVWLRQDGTAYKTILESSQKNRYYSDPVFKAAADSAIRAVKLCSPIQNLPANKYSRWKEMRLHFDPRMQLY